MITNSALSVNPFDRERYLGIVSQVTRSTIEVAFAILSDTSTGYGEGQHAAGANVGQYIVIACGRLALFGQVIAIRAPQRSDLRLALEDQQFSSRATVQLLTTIEVDSGNVYPGILNYPQIGNHVFLAHPRLVQLIVETQHGAVGEEKPLLLSFAKLSGTEPTPVTVTPEMLFGRHCAILGTTGGGKSWSLARLMEETGNHRAKVILFDATGEFSPLRGGTRHVYLGHDPHPLKGSREVVLPYFHLTEGDLFAIFKPRGQSQAPKLRAAIKSLKLAKLAPTLAPDGTIIKAHKSKDRYELEYNKHFAAIENPIADFDVTSLIRQVENECVKPNRSALEPMYWGDINGVDQASCIPLINRIQDIIQSPNLASIFDPQNKPSLIRAIDLFLQDEASRILRISLKYLSFAHNAREIVANAAGRHLLQLAREGRFLNHPLLVVLDEAHQFLNTTLEDADSSFPLDAFSTVAKEGRKYSLSICIATQRPRDIPEDVLSQMGTLLVHRLINDRDRAVIERASGDIDQSSLETLPTLAPGEAIILGIDFPIPLAIQVEAPAKPPEFRGPNFQKFWRQ